MSVPRARRLAAPIVSRRGVLIAGLALAAMLLPPRHSDAVDSPVVAAAADLDAALPEIADLFAKSTGRQVRLTFGSSGNFAQQIRQGAPFEMFMSADEGYVRALSDERLTMDAGTLYAIGRIGIFAPNGSPLKVDAAMKDLGVALADGRLKKFAIANPEHAPYGRAAREALMHAGLWDGIESKLLLGENVAQATQFATSGSAQGGIIPLSLARSPAVAALGRFALIPESWHDPLRQRMVLLKRAGETARAFYAFMQRPGARAVMERYGFVLPGSTT